MHIDLCCWKRSDQGSQSGRQVSKFCFCFSMNLNFFFLCELKENYLTVLNYSIVLYLVACVWLFATPCTVAFQAPLSMGILQARILEWVAMPSSRESSQPRDLTQVSHIADGFFTIWATREAQYHWSVKSLSRVRLFVTPWTAARQASLSTNSWSLLKLMSVALVMQSNHLILCCPLLFCLQSFLASGSFPMGWFFISGG